MNSLHKLNKPLLLCGFMGTGKSTIGKLLAGKLGVPYTDTDDMITKKVGMPISMIFQKHGEPYFRDMEYEIACNIAHVAPCVVSTGGGMLTFERNAEVLKDTTTIVCLTRDFESLYTLLARDSSRPVAYGKSYSEIQRLYNTRLSSYTRYASLIIANDSTPDVCVSSILSQL